MEKPVQILLVFLAFHLLGAASNEGWWSIDCGGSSSRVVDGSISWEIDTNYTKAGSNMRVRQNQALEEMNTLRFFPNQTDNNCYIIPLKFPGYNYIVRAGFYYGNYDGLSKPPTFDLKLDRENWTTVNTSSSVDGGLPIYHEAIYLTRSGNLTVCLVQTRDGEVPFISSLEGVPITNLYEEVLDTTTATLHLVARTNFGGSEVIRFPDDSYNRVWTRGAIPPNCHANVSIPIDVNLPLQYSTPLPAYFVFYFADLASTRVQGDIRTMKIYINGQEKTTITLQVESLKGIAIYPMDVMGSTINITLIPTNQSTLPPMINGMEIFTRHDLTAQLTPPMGPYPNDISKCLPSLLVIVIHTIYFVALFI
ncbi:putative leucine-rich repeat receptor-like serine/threonine-protein kinase [Vitis vinifera]|uniref:Putative leucine-rich repeat receptor-like serine/threonine-protein kinase n=1 Tax=Vitis vinifera TaxID=29760 RepID=A0A438JXZ1_VITVI|nr:putative leucine-rich repeat receptor-like serine/threonine-protein kinase [Vitis vinifera]